jgi:hypothetical protein
MFKLSEKFFELGLVLRFYVLCECLLLLFASIGAKTVLAYFSLG